MPFQGHWRHRGKEKFAHLLDGEAFLSTFFWIYFNEFLGVSHMKSESVPIQYYFGLISILSAWIFAMVQTLIMGEFQQTFCALEVWMDREMHALEILVVDWCVRIKLQEVNFGFLFKLWILLNIFLVVSFGFGCGRRNFPGAYVDVSQYNDWITECINSNINHEDIPRPSTVNPR